MKRTSSGPLLVLAVLAAGGFLSSCGRPEPRMFTFGILESVESPTLDEARRGFFKALEDGGLQTGVDVRFLIRNSRGDVARLQEHARELAASGADIIVPMSTQSLQAALNTGSKTPIVFSSVANPFLTRAGVSESEHLSHVTGVASTAPLRQALALIREALPRARRLGTIWTPAEINSEYYLEIIREAAAEYGFEIEAVPVTGPGDVILASQILMNRAVDVVLPVSDNTINTAFEDIGRVADENRMPLFGAFLLAARGGASAAVGWDFFDMGYKAGQIALRVKNGENPGRIPFLSMTDVRLVLNSGAAERQGVRFPEEILRRANGVSD